MKKSYKVGKTGEKGNQPNHGIYGDRKAMPFSNEVGASEGGASRFFYTAKASRAERNIGCEELEKGNNHPTIKPLSLIIYLCRITMTPTKGIVLDPFMGSGTTGMACKRLKREFIGIEREKEYCEIARRRIEATKPIEGDRQLKLQFG